MIMVNVEHLGKRNLLTPGVCECGRFIFYLSKTVKNKGPATTAADYNFCSILVDILGVSVGCYV